MHDTEYYKNQTSYSRKTIKRLNLDTDIANSDIIIADYYWTDDEGGLTHMVVVVLTMRLIHM